MKVMYEYLLYFFYYFLRNSLYEIFLCLYFIVFKFFYIYLLVSYIEGIVFFFKYEDYYGYFIYLVNLGKFV